MFVLCQEDSDLVEPVANNRLPFSWNDACPLRLLIIDIAIGQAAEDDIFLLNVSSAQVIDLVRRIYCLLYEETLVRGSAAPNKSGGLTS
jgi:hypothetical protein